MWKVTWASKRSCTTHEQVHLDRDRAERHYLAILQWARWATLEPVAAD